MVPSTRTNCTPELRTILERRSEIAEGRGPWNSGVRTASEAPSSVFQEGGSVASATPVETLDGESMRASESTCSSRGDIDRGRSQSFAAAKAWGKEPKSAPLAGPSTTPLGADKELRRSVQAMHLGQEVQLEKVSTKVTALRAQNALLVTEFKEMSRKCREERQGLEARLEESGAAGQTIEQLQRQNAQLQQVNGLLKREVQSYQTLASENGRLVEKLNQMESELRRSREEPAWSTAEEPAAPNPEGRLRQLMTDQAASSEQLMEAVAAVEAVINEAKREIGNKRFRERRAAFEQLYYAIDKDREDLLEEAIAAARRAEVDAEDIAKAEDKVAVLRSLTDEQRAAKATLELKRRLKEQAFLFVKRDNVQGLSELLASVDPEMRWQEWKDYAGRTLWRCSHELRALQVQKVLSVLLGFAQPAEAAKPKALEPLPSPRKEDQEPAQVLLVNLDTSAQAGESQEAAVAQGKARAYTAPPMGSETAPASAMSSLNEPLTTPRDLASCDAAELKLRAFRAVVRDDYVAVSEVLTAVPLETWSKWRNKAGKGLVSLSEERGSSQAYTVLAAALGILQEMKAEAFEEREAVWIFLPGEVQPRRASVLEDTPAEAPEVLIEYWDNEDPPLRVERCLVRKMG